MAERAGGVVKKGHEEGLKMAVSLLEEFGLPLGLLPLADVIEVGFVRATGYMWIAQRKKVEHQFKLVGKQVSYDVEVTGYVSARRIKKLKGVKAKELMLWPPVNEITVDDPPRARSTSRASPASPRPSRSRRSPRDSSRARAHAVWEARFALLVYVTPPRCLMICRIMHKRAPT